MHNVFATILCRFSYSLPYLTLHLPELKHASTLKFLIFALSYTNMKYRTLVCLLQTEWSYLLRRKAL